MNQTNLTELVTNYRALMETPDSFEKYKKLIFLTTIVGHQDAETKDKFMQILCQEKNYDN